MRGKGWGERDGEKGKRKMGVGRGERDEEREKRGKGSEEWVEERRVGERGMWRSEEGGDDASRRGEGETGRRRVRGGKYEDGRSKGERAKGR